MHPKTFPMAYMSARQHEQLPCLYTTTAHNHTVSAAQTLAGLHNKIRQLRDTEQFLQIKIHQYRSSLDKIQSDLHVNINRANEMQNFLAPISRLPNEMLLAIFEEVVASQEPGADFGRAEFIVSRVSRRWRDLAIHTPRLWRRVSITPRVSPAMLEIYKTRGSRALDIEIWGWKDRRDFQRFDSALEKMVDSAGRWRSLTIACVCDSHLSHLTLKLSHVGHFSSLKHFTFRALRPGQRCSVSFLTEPGTTAHNHSASPPQSPCTLKSLDAENFILAGDPSSIHTRAVQNFSRLSSLTLRRYSNDQRSLRIMIDFSAFRAMLNAVPHLTTLVLHGQPLRFRTDPVGTFLGQDDLQGSGVGFGGGIGAAGNSAIISLPNLHTLVFHPGVLKPRYLQHTISAIQAPALRHFELVFPDSKISGQNIVERLFLDASPSLTSSYTSTTEEYMRKRHPRFPHVETLVLNNALTAGNALAFVHAFPCTTQLSLGGADAGCFPLALRASGGGPGVGVGTGVGTRMGPYDGRGMSTSIVASGSGATTRDYAKFTYWHRLDTLTLRQPRTDALRLLFDWIQQETERRHVVPMMIVQGSGLLMERSDIQIFVRCARNYTRVELVEVRDPAMTMMV